MKRNTTRPHMHTAHEHHDQPHPHPHDHDQSHKRGLWDWVKTIFHLDGHSHGSKVADEAFQANEEGIRTVWLSLALLLVTAVIQLVIVYFSSSVSLFADTAHNIGDGLNSIPLLVAFYLAQRLPTRRYTYGYGRAEDIAGIFIVVSIAISAYIVFQESIQRFMNPQPLTNLGWVALAAVIGFLGNEAVALLQIRVGRKIGSAAMVADGMHARTDGLTSLAVLLAAGGTWLGFPILDPIIGLLIGFAIVAITWDASKTIWYRLMDAVDPQMLEQVEQIVETTDGVQNIGRLRMRWLGHQLQAELRVTLSPKLTVEQGHQTMKELQETLQKQIPTLSDLVIELHT